MKERAIHKHLLRSLAGILAFLLLVTLIPASAVSAASKVTLSKTKATLYIGATLQLTLKNAPSKVTWSTKDSKIATVTSKGKITAKKAGTTNIIAKCASKSYTCKVTVKNAKLNATTKTLYAKGSSYTLKVTGSTASSYKSSKPTVATVSTKGVIKPLKAGTTNITVTCKNKQKLTCKVTVKKPSLNATKVSLVNGKTSTLKLTGATVKSWSTSNKKVATVSSKGVVTAVAGGTAKITAKGADGNKYTCNVTVEALNHLKTTLYLNDAMNQTVQLKAVNFTAKSWKSSDKTVASVNSKGLVSAKKKGTTTITCTGTNGKKYTAKITVTELSFPMKYVDDTATITIDRKIFEAEAGSTVYYVAHLQYKDYTRLQTCYSNNDPGSKEDPFDMADRVKPILAVNGDASMYINHLWPGIKGGIVGGDANATSVDINASYDSSKGILSAWKYGSSSKKISKFNNGTLSTFQFGPVLVQDGEINPSAVCGYDNHYLDPEDPTSRNIPWTHQRTFIGTTGEPGDIYIVVGQGRYCDGNYLTETGSIGLRFQDEAQIMKDLGCTYALNLDGGDSTFFYFNGHMINAYTLESQRNVWDFVYFK